MLTWNKSYCIRHCEERLICDQDNDISIGEHTDNEDCHEVAWVIHDSYNKQFVATRYGDEHDTIDEAKREAELVFACLRKIGVYPRKVSE